MALEHTLRAMERSDDAYWRRHPDSSRIKLQWRAATVRHCFHVLPTESVLQLGAGSGTWTEHLVKALRAQNPVTAAVFNSDLAALADARDLPNTRIRHVNGLDDLGDARFDYVVGTGVLSHEGCDETLALVYRLLKPGGQALFFEANYRNPQVFASAHVGRLRRWTGDAHCHTAMGRPELMKRASREGFTSIESAPFDLIHPAMPPSVIARLESTAFVLEHAPVLGDMCGTQWIWLTRPGPAQRPRANLAVHGQLFGSTSVVVPCHNEAMNVGRLIDALVGAYDAYIHEIIIVDDNSTDGTADVVRDASCADPRVKLVRRGPPNGVGRALRDGYAAATGRYILTMDCDFVLLVPELRDLFDCIAQGRDGAIGSRFSHESVLVNYPFLKIVCNRVFHWLLRLMLPVRARDLSNNLKLYRAEILKTLEIEAPHFAANVETGLKPLLAGYDIAEVPVSWINRTAGMGVSSFRLVRAGPGYAAALMRIVWRVRRGKRAFTRPMTRLGAASESVDRV
jgi:SAM-dependent methyltransferase